MTQGIKFGGFFYMVGRDTQKQKNVEQIMKKEAVYSARIPNLHPSMNDQVGGKDVFLLLVKPEEDDKAKAALDQNGLRYVYKPGEPPAITRVPTESKAPSAKEVRSALAEFAAERGISLNKVLTVFNRKEDMTFLTTSSGKELSIPTKRFKAIEALLTQQGVKFEKKDDGLRVIGTEDQLAALNQFLNQPKK